MLRFAFLGRDIPVLSGPRLTLRFPQLSDYDQWASLRRDSRGYLEPWEPRWTHDELERAAWKQRVKRYRVDYLRGAGMPFLIFLNDGGLAGGISLGNIRRGVAQTGQIGYWIGERYSGTGLMTEAVGMIVNYGFNGQRLHRIEAACVPDNQRSQRVLEKVGFVREGLLRSYLKINGIWQDHYLYALIDEEYHRRTMRGAAIAER